MKTKMIIITMALLGIMACGDKDEPQTDADRIIGDWKGYKCSDGSLAVKASFGNTSVYWETEHSSTLYVNYEFEDEYLVLYDTDSAQGLWGYNFINDDSLHLTYFIWNGIECDKLYFTKN